MPDFRLLLLVPGELNGRSRAPHAYGSAMAAIVATFD